MYFSISSRKLGCIVVSCLWLQNQLNINLRIGIWHFFKDNVPTERYCNSYSFYTDFVPTEQRIFSNLIHIQTILKIINIFLQTFCFYEAKTFSILN
jgi:hypothetical protein